SVDGPRTRRDSVGRRTETHSSCGIRRCANQEDPYRERPRGKRPNAARRANRIEIGQSSRAARRRRCVCGRDLSYSCATQLGGYQFNKLDAALIASFSRRACEREEKRGNQKRFCTRLAPIALSFAAVP